MISCSFTFQFIGALYNLCNISMFMVAVMMYVLRTAVSEWVVLVCTYP